MSSSNKLSQLVLGILALFTAFAFITSNFGWKIHLELLSHFQAQYLAIAAILLVILLLLRHKWHICIGLFLCTILSLPVLTWYLPPRYLFDSSETADLKVLVANINTQNTSYDKVIELVRREKPDLAIFMEVDEVWQTQLDSLKDLLPYSSGQSSAYNLGLLVYSNQSLNDSQVEFFGTERNASVVAQLTVSQKPVTLLATHLLPPVKPSFFQSRNQQLNRIIQYLTEIDDRTILAGDLNTTMWSPYYRRLVNKTGLNNTRKGFGILPTWFTEGTYDKIPDWSTALFSIPIDHCLISPGLKTVSISTGNNIGSDHLPLIISLRVI